MKEYIERAAVLSYPIRKDHIIRKYMERDKGGDHDKHPSDPV